MSEVSDLAFGIAVFVVFLAVVAVAGFLLHRFSRARYARAWAPLVPVIGGQVRGEGGAARSWLHGSYQGRPVVAGISPMAGQRGRVGSTTTGAAANFFLVAITGLSGRQDWRVLFSADGGWRIEAGDPGVQQRLAGSELIGRIAALGYPSPAISTVRLPVLDYTARNGELVFREDAGSSWLPDPDRFRTELDTLVAIAAIDDRLNR
jgi:hypothetical protein